MGNARHGNGTRFPVYIAFFLLLFVNHIAMADESCVNMTIDFDKQSRIVILMFENVCESEIVIENSFGFSDKELESSSLWIESLESDEHLYPYGISVKFASKDMELLSRHEMSDEGYVQNRVFESSLLEEKTMIVRHGIKYAKRLRLLSIVVGMENYLDFDLYKMTDVFIKIRLELFMRKPAKMFVKETEWMFLD
jgi:hypothetical protein